MSCENCGSLFEGYGIYCGNCEAILESIYPNLTEDEQKTISTYFGFKKKQKLEESLVMNKPPALIRALEDIFAKCK